MNRPPKRFYEFDQFRIDIEERQLLRVGRPVMLTPKVFDILLTLVENNGHTVGKDKLMELVWADSYVDEGNLNRNVSTLRKVLGEDSHKPRFIKTVPKRGYRFESAVHEIVEEDDAVIIEKRTKLRVTLRAESEVRTSGLSTRVLLFAATAVSVLLIGFVWAMIRPATSDANSLNPEIAKGTKSGQAYELYRKGRALWQNRSVESLQQATIDLEQAVRIDPQFALAHAALADAYAFDVVNWKKAESVASDAIRLNPSLGEPHATIGFVRTFWEWRLSDAEASFRQSIALNPNYATAHQWYAITLMLGNSGGNGLGEMKRALELEPESVSINGDMCQMLYFSNKYDQAIEQCQRTLKMDPNFLPVHQYLYAIYTAKGMYPEALDAYFRYEELSMTTQTHPNRIEGLKKAFAAGGIRAFWRERIKILSQMSPPQAYQIGQYQTWLGNHDEAIHWFKRAADEHSFDFLFFDTDPAHAQIFADPRAKDLAKNLER